MLIDENIAEKVIVKRAKKRMTKTNTALALNITRGTLNKIEQGNMEKIIIDCVKDLIIEDDCQFFQETLRKVPSDERKVEIQIYEEDPLYFLNSIRDTSLTGDILIKLDTYRNEI